MLKTTVNVDGMACGMCEAHVCDAIRKVVPEAKKLSASHGKKIASFVTDGEIDENAVREAIDATGYRCLSIETAPYEKKGLFSFGKK